MRPAPSVGYSSSFNAGLPDELKFSVSGTDLQRLMSANSLSFNGNLPANLDALPDANIDPYADDFYKYTTAGLVEEIDAAGGGCSGCGGVGESTFAYAYSGSTNYAPTNGTPKPSRPVPMAARLPSSLTSRAKPSSKIPGTASPAAPHSTRSFTINTIATEICSPPISPRP